MVRPSTLGSQTFTLNCPALCFYGVVAGGSDPASSKHHFQTVPTLAAKYCCVGQPAPGGLWFWVLPNPVPRESHSRSHRFGSGKVRNNFSLSGMLLLFLLFLGEVGGDILSLFK